MCCFYNGQKAMISKHLGKIQNMDIMSKRDKNNLLIGDYNVEPNETPTYDFCKVYRISNIKSNTRY